MLGLSARAFGEGASAEAGAIGKRAGARRTCGRRADLLSGLKRVSDGSRDLPLWVDLQLMIGTALIDTGAQLTCFRVDVAEFIYLRGVMF
jgi:hypothetical protein